MKKPDIERMWEMAIRIPNQIDVHRDMLRTHISPLTSVLKEKCGVKWYCFLLHNSANGVPILYDGGQFHIRFENTLELDKRELIKNIPDYCEMLRKIPSSKVNQISGIDQNLLMNDDICEAWRIIGETCEWILSIIDAHKPEISIPPNQIAQFLHYIANITQIRIG